MPLQNARYAPSLDRWRFFGKPVAWFWQVCFYSVVLLQLLEVLDEILTFTGSKLKLRCISLLKAQSHDEYASWGTISFPMPFYILCSRDYQSCLALSFHLADHKWQEAQSFNTYLTEVRWSVTRQTAGSPPRRNRHVLFLLHCFVLPVCCLINSKWDYCLIARHSDRKMQSGCRLCIYILILQKEHF